MNNFIKLPKHNYRSQLLINNEDNKSYEEDEFRINRKTYIDKYVNLIKKYLSDDKNKKCVIKSIDQPSVKLIAIVEILKREFIG